MTKKEKKQEATVFRNQFCHINTQFDVLITRVTRLERDRTGLKDKVNELMDQMASAQKEIETLRKQLQDTKNGWNQGEKYEAAAILTPHEKKEPANKVRPQVTKWPSEPMLSKNYNKATHIPKLCHSMPVTKQLSLRSDSLTGEETDFGHQEIFHLKSSSASMSLDGLEEKIDTNGTLDFQRGHSNRCVANQILRRKCDQKKEQWDQKTSTSAESDVSSDKSSGSVLHTRLLALTCRLCGGSCPGDINIHLTMKSSLRDYFGVDIRKDHRSVHPKVLCHTCEEILRKFRSMTQPERLAFTEELKETGNWPGPCQFAEHSAACKICYVSKED